MIQPPVTGEASHTTAAHRHRARRPRPQRSHHLISAVIAAALIIGASAFALLLSRPSYPHPWCAAVLAELHSKGGSEQAYENAMTQIEDQDQDQAPVGQLLSDLYTYDAAYASEQSANNFGALGAISNSMAALNAVSDDLQAINRDCGQPGSAYKNDTY
jgi:hypothetical protein